VSTLSLKTETAMPARFLALSTLLLLAFTTASCVDHESLALAELESTGFGEIALEHSGGAGHAYNVKAQRDGIACKGLISVTAMPGSSAASFVTDMHCKKPGPPKPEFTAEELALKAAEAACEAKKEACVALGDLLVHGPLTTRDLERARAVHDKACKAGVLDACSHLGNLQLRGLGGERSEEAAEASWTGACEKESMLGCANLGRLRYINRKFKDAKPLFETACKGGEMTGCEGLGKMLREGAGGKEDMTGARKWFQMACDGGHMSGCTNLGVMYAKGEGGGHNMSRASELLTLACESGLQAACSHKRRLIK
jgi:TPR repeat protein